MCALFLRARKADIGLLLAVGNESLAPPDLLQKLLFGEGSLWVDGVCAPVWEDSVASLPDWLLWLLWQFHPIPASGAQSLATAGRTAVAAPL